MSGRRNSGGDGGGHGGGGEERWLLPYADMITLLLGLFIVLFAMSTINPHKFDNVRRSLSQTFSGEVLQEPGEVLQGSSGVMDPSAPSENQDARVINDLTQSAKASDAQFKEQGRQIQRVATAKLGNDVKVTINERSIVVTLAGDALFDSGQSSLKPNVVDKLTVLEREMQKLNRPLEIAGHTDAAPFNGKWGNWALSRDRADSVLMFFLQNGYDPKLLTPKYYAATRPVVDPPKGNPLASVKANRRIEITILAPGATDPRPRDAQVRSMVKPVGGGGGTASLVDQQLHSAIDGGLVGQIADTAKDDA